MSSTTSDICMVLGFSAGVPALFWTEEKPPGRTGRAVGHAGTSALGLLAIVPAEPGRRHLSDCLLSEGIGERRLSRCWISPALAGSAGVGLSIGRQVHGVRGQQHLAGQVAGV